MSCQTRMKEEIYHYESESKGKNHFRIQKKSNLMLTNMFLRHFYWNLYFHIFPKNFNLNDIDRSLEIKES